MRDSVRGASSRRSRTGALDRAARDPLGKAAIARATFAATTADSASGAASDLRNTASDATPGPDAGRTPPAVAASARPPRASASTGWTAAALSTDLDKQDAAVKLHSSERPTFVASGNRRDRHL